MQQFFLEQPVFRRPPKKEIARILQDQIVHYRTHNVTPLVPILSEKNLATLSLFPSPKINSSITLPIALTSCRTLLYCNSSHHNLLYISVLRHICHIFHDPCFGHPNHKSREAQIVSRFTANLNPLVIRDLKI